MNQQQLKKLEEILISQTPKEELLYYIRNLSTREKTILLRYLGLEEDGIKYNLQSIATMLNLSLSHTAYIKESVYEHIRIQIINEISKGNKISYEDYLNYLIRKYILCNKYKKNRKR